MALVGLPMKKTMPSDDEPMHATVELVSAMAGKFVNHHYTNAIQPACKPDDHSEYWTEFTVWAHASGVASTTRDEDTDGPVTCPKCLLLMFNAIDPVRRDYLLEKGILKEL